MRISLNGLKANEIPLMLEELGNLGEVKDPHQTEHSLDVTPSPRQRRRHQRRASFVLEPEQTSLDADAARRPSRRRTLPETVAGRRNRRRSPALRCLPPNLRGRSGRSAESTRQGERIYQHSRSGGKGGSADQPGGRAGDHPVDAGATFRHAGSGWNRRDPLNSMSQAGA